MEYGIIRSDNNIKFLFKIINIAEFGKAFNNITNGSRKTGEFIEFLGMCEAQGWIKLKNSASIIMWRWEDV